MCTKLWILWTISVLGAYAQNTGSSPTGTILPITQETSIQQSQTTTNLSMTVTSQSSTSLDNLTNTQIKEHTKADSTTSTTSPNSLVTPLTSTDAVITPHLSTTVHTESPSINTGQPNTIANSITTDILKASYSNITKTITTSTAPGTYTNDTTITNYISTPNHTANAPESHTSTTNAPGSNNTTKAPETQSSTTSPPESKSSLSTVKETKSLENQETTTVPDGSNKSTTNPTQVSETVAGEGSPQLHTSGTPHMAFSASPPPHPFNVTVDANKTVGFHERVCAQLMEVINETGNCNMAGVKTNDVFKYKSIQLIPEADPSVETNNSRDFMTKTETKNLAIQNTSTAAITSSCGALLLILIGFALYCRCHRSSYRKNQQHLTEELQTMENGYHDNPTLEVMEVQPEMQEKKVALNEFNDSWIVPYDNLAKDDIPDEEDTHL